MFSILFRNFLILVSVIVAASMLGFNLYGALAMFIGVLILGRLMRAIRR